MVYIHCYYHPCVHLLTLGSFFVLTLTESVVKGFLHGANFRDSVINFPKTYEFFAKGAKFWHFANRPIGGFQGEGGLQTCLKLT